MIRLTLASTVFVSLVLAVLIYVDAQDQIQALLTWIDDQGLYGPLLFMLVMAQVVILALTGVMFTTVVGFSFGMIVGSIVVFLGTTLGATGGGSTGKIWPG